ncbi:alpha-ketoglutarate decarboxylase [Sediminicola sp. 1XM1-17]|uniref:alpha-ketoglutarate decarboxylase n=1 Tax=Sediminicola sp. 1XM1-17 TaxID=3127702 RepID=UPI0030772FAD
MKRQHYVSIQLILAIFLTFSSFSALGQGYQNSGDFWGKVRYGGGVGLGFGQDTFTAVLAPSAIYQASEYVAVGAGLNFNYSKFQDSKLTAYGGSLITLVNPIRPIQLSAELEQLRVNRRFEYEGADIVDNYWSPALFAGIGYSNGNVTFGIRYDLLYDEEKSIYADPFMPFVRFYF